MRIYRSETGDRWTGIADPERIPHGPIHPALPVPVLRKKERQIQRTGMGRRWLLPCVQKSRSRKIPMAADSRGSKRDHIGTVPVADAGTDNDAKEESEQGTSRIRKLTQNFHKLWTTQKNKYGIRNGSTDAPIFEPV